MKRFGKKEGFVTGLVLFLTFCAVMSIGHADSVSVSTADANKDRCKLPDTGQTQSCTHIFGEDSDYVINPPSYAKLDENGDVLPDSAAQWAMVKDNVTGLTWENKTDDGGIHDKDNTYTWENANGVFIARLNAEKSRGYSDWRLPTVKELSMLVNAGRWNPAINTSYFEYTMSSCYWSSTALSDNSKRAWQIYFGSGNVSHHYKSRKYYVRAVRGGQAGGFADPVIPGRMMDNGDGTVSDIQTGLMWQRAETGEMAWTAALTYCENLNLANHTDWRLPNRNELQSLIDYSVHNPATDTVFFSGIVSKSYWSSTTLAYTYAQPLHVFFKQGSVLYGYKSLTLYVRAVRGGQ